MHRLSVGFYESIFTSYMANKVCVWFQELLNLPLTSLQPVRVVTSMGKRLSGLWQPVLTRFNLGEQSVGKSYALNHLMDTSFAGSAMRCTEGVWLSATPTRDTLIVAMDFEGT